MLKRIILSLIGVVVGALIIRYREKVQAFTGSVSFAERYLGAGGTFTFYILLGFATILLSIFYLTGILDDMALKIFGRIL